MKRQIIENLILSHYNNDRVAFFNNALEVLKEFRKDGCKELADRIEFELHQHLKVVPILEKDNYIKETNNPNIDEDDNLVSNYSCGFVPQGAEEQDYSVCPKCGGHNIIRNKDIANPWIKCQDCGHYLRKGKESLMSKELDALKKWDCRGCEHLEDNCVDKDCPMQIIETALKRLEKIETTTHSVLREDISKKLLVLEVIKQKDVNVEYIKCCDTYEQYKTICSYWNEITESDFNLLKEVLKDE